MDFKFKSFSSGSCGNCYMLRLDVSDGRKATILIDAGVSLRRLKADMAQEGLNPDEVDAILVTHDHLDHIRSLGSYCKKLQKPVWGTEILLNALSHHTFTLDHIGAVKKQLEEGCWNPVVPGMVEARYFVVPHDATQTVGYALRLYGSQDIDFVIMTDIGGMTREALEFARQATNVVIESNYDVDMLLSGPYTHELKMRICQGSGHLSNDHCAEAIAKFRHEGLQHVFLCHLSENNNTPEKAYECSLPSLEGTSTELSVLPRRHATPVFTLHTK